GFAVDLEDDVAGHDAGLVGWGADHGADDGELTTLLTVVADVDADAAELALGVLVELLVVAGVDVLRVRVEAFQPAVDHVLDELAFAVGVDVNDVLLADLVEHVHEEANEFVVLVLLPGGGAVRHRQAQQGNGGDAQQPEQVPARHVKPTPLALPGPGTAL